MDAGYAPNQFQARASDESLMRAYIDLIQELGRVPIEGEIRRKAKDGATFPSHTSFSRFGGKEKLIDAVADFCERSTGFGDVIAILANVTRSSKEPSIEDMSVGLKVSTGFVYLMKSGPHNKIGRTNSVGRRASELGIKFLCHRKPFTISKLTIQ